VTGAFFASSVMQALAVLEPPRPLPEFAPAGPLIHGEVDQTIFLFADRDHGDQYVAVHGRIRTPAAMARADS